MNPPNPFDPQSQAPTLAITTIVGLVIGLFLALTTPTSFSATVGNSLSGKNTDRYETTYSRPDLHTTTGDNVVPVTEKSDIEAVLTKGLGDQDAGFQFSLGRDKNGKPAITTIVGENGVCGRWSRGFEGTDDGRIMLTPLNTETVHIPEDHPDICPNKQLFRHFVTSGARLFKLTDKPDSYIIGNKVEGVLLTTGVDPSDMGITNYFPAPQVRDQLGHDVSEWKEIATSGAGSTEG